VTSVRTLAARLSRIEATSKDAGHSGVELMSDDQLRATLREQAAELEAAGDHGQARLTRGLADDTLSAAEIRSMARLDGSPALMELAEKFSDEGCA
jgi:hypothetical protein